MDVEPNQERPQHEIYELLTCFYLIFLKGIALRRQSIMDMKTKRKIFETVKSHLLTQKAKCINNFGGCKYRVNGPNGVLKCAIGALIPDSEYTSEMDDALYITKIGDDCSLEIENNPLVKDVLSSIYGELDLEFLVQLQKIHDCTKVEDWEELLNNFEETELEMSIL